MTATITNRPDGHHSRASAEILENRVAELQDALERRSAQHTYSELLHTIRDLVHICIPKDSVILAISKGDDDLINWRRRRGWHFPQADNGAYAGHHPANSAESIVHLEELRGRGADYLLIPKNAFWWLEFYSDFTQHLQNNYQIGTYQEDVCIIYRLMKTS